MNDWIDYRCKYRGDSCRWEELEWHNRYDVLTGEGAYAKIPRYSKHHSGRPDHLTRCLTSLTLHAASATGRFKFCVTSQFFHVTIFHQLEKPTIELTQRCPCNFSRCAMRCTCPYARASVTRSHIRLPHRTWTFYKHACLSVSKNWLLHISKRHGAQNQELQFHTRRLCWLRTESPGE